MKLAIIVLSFLLSYNLFSWGSHYLVMDQTLKHPSMLNLAQEKAKVEPIEDFLKAENKKIAILFKEYYEWLGKKGSKRFKAQSFDENNPTLENFLKAARLNPKTKISLVNRLMPGQIPTYKEVKVDDISPYISQGSRTVNFEDITGQIVTAHSVLCSFVDEPDWGMDLNLWTYTEFGYGKQPYGKPEGTSTQAPFHITYLHENQIVKNTVPELTEGMSLDRMELFSRLSNLAKQTGHDYWAYRFAAWTIHYIQDLSQPYHAVAIPSAKWTYYVAFVFTTNKEKVKNKVMQLIANKHFAYEEFVALGLEKSYLTDYPLYRHLAEFPYKGDAFITDEVVDNYEKLILYVTRFSSSHGSALDETIRFTFGRKLTEEEDFDFEKEQKSGAFDMEKFIPTLNKERSDLLLKETGRDFEMAGRATRTTLKLLGLVK